MNCVIFVIMTKRAFKYRFYPTPEQEQLLAQTFGCVRFVYNHILRWRTDEYYKNGNSVNYNTASKQLTELKKNPDHQWLKDVSSVPIQQALRHQQTAFKNFWGRQSEVSNFQEEARKTECHLCGFRFQHERRTTIHCQKQRTTEYPLEQRAFLRTLQHHDQQRQGRKVFRFHAL